MLAGQNELLDFQRSADVRGAGMEAKNEHGDGVGEGEGGGEEDRVMVVDGVEEQVMERDEDEMEKDVGEVGGGTAVHGEEGMEMEEEEEEGGEEQEATASRRKRIMQRMKRREQNGSVTGGGLLSAFGQAFRNFLADDGSLEEALVSENASAPSSSSSAQVRTSENGSFGPTAVSAETRSESDKLRGLLARKTQVHRQEMEDRRDEIAALNDTVAMLRAELRERVENAGAKPTSAADSEKLQKLHQQQQEEHRQLLHQHDEERKKDREEAKRQADMVADMHAREREAMRAEHDAKTTQLTVEHDTAVARLRAEHETSTAILSAEHETAVTKLQGEADAKLSKLEAEHATAMQALREELSHEPEVDALKAERDKLQLQSTQLGTQLDETRRELSALRESAASAAAAAKQARTEHEAEVEAIKAECVEGIQELQAGHDASLSKIHGDHESAIRRLRDEMTREREDALRDTRLKLAQEKNERRRLHNIIVDMKGNIRVFVRIRPPTSSAATTANGDGIVGALEVRNDGDDDDGRVRVLPPPERAMLDKGMEYAGFAKVSSKSKTNTHSHTDAQAQVKNSTNRHCWT